MNFLKYALIVPLLIGCNSKNNSIDVLKENTKNYTKLSNTYAYRSDSVIVFIHFNGKKVDFDLIEKNQDEDIDITECKISKNIYTPIPLSSDSDKLYIIELAKKKNSIKLICKLSNDEIIRMKLRKY